MTLALSTLTTITPETGAEIARLHRAVIVHDGVDPLDEAARLSLEPDAAQGATHVLAREDDGTLAGYANVLADGTVQAMVAPDRRRRGVGRALTQEVRELAPDPRPWAHGALADTLVFCGEMGLVPVRTLLTMRCDLGVQEMPRRETERGRDSGVQVRSFDLALDAEDFLALNARVFAEHPEQGGLDRAGLDARIAQDWFDPADFLVARRSDGAAGESAAAGEMLGFVWTKREPVEAADSASTAPPGGTAEIYVVGTAPEAQGTGIATRLLTSALRRLREDGVESVELYVEGDNTGAVALYERLGFEVAGRDVQFAWPAPAPRLAQELPADRFCERELSWLAFNERVQELSSYPGVPLLERVRFCSIFASNLDEFFMVRVAGLTRRLETGLAVTGPSGMPPRQVLEKVRRRAQELQVAQGRIFDEQLRPALAAEAGIVLVGWEDLEESERTALRDFFREEVFPVLTPLAVDPVHPFPYISGLSLNLVVRLREQGQADAKIRTARVKVPDSLPRFVRVGSAAGASEGEGEDARLRFIGLEQIIAANLDQLFDGMDICSSHLFRVTRNEDMEVEEDDAENLLHALERELLRRRFGAPVRLEAEEGIDPQVRDWLVRELQISPAAVVALPSLLDLRGLDQIADLDLPALRFEPFMPATSTQLNEVETAAAADVLAAVRKGDVLLHHPYDAFSTSVQAFLEQAAADPQVLAIKQTLYRTSGDSPIVDALIDAAQAGKQVLACVEITARFDEEANISWARQLEQAGVHVVYGVAGLKTHAKASMVVRQEEGRLRRYCHVGTGNYHPRTARRYEDLGLLTCDEQVGADLTRLFNQLSGYAPRTSFGRLLVAPRSVRAGLLELIEQEIEHHEAGAPARIRIKCNSIVDETLIDALYRASNAGVPVDIVVRGICALRPGVPGLSENIRVRSILGRFLEHSRVYSFAAGGAPVVLIGSADLMHRNLDRRVEALVPLRRPEHVAHLEELLDLLMDDATASWHLDAAGTWNRRVLDASGERLRDAQAELIARHRRPRRRA